MPRWPRQIQSELAIARTCPIARLIRESRRTLESEHGARIRVSVHISYFDRYQPTTSCVAGEEGFEPSTF